MTDHKPETPRDGWDPERPVVLDNQYVHIDDYDSLLALYRALRQQLAGATANEQSVVTEEAHDRDQLALVVEQKDDISVRCANLEKALKNARYGFMDIALLCADANRKDGTYDFAFGFIKRIGTIVDQQDDALEELQRKRGRQRSPQRSASATGGRLRKALHMAQSELNYQYQTLCSSVCPPCKQGERYDYSELRPEERAEIDRVEAALDAVDAALAETEDK